MKNKNFKPLTLQQEKSICAAGIISGIISGISSLASTADTVSNTVIKNKIVSKMDDVKKGEIELGKNGEIRLKWDALSTDDETNPIKSTVIF